MRVSVGEVEKEWLLPVLLNETNRLLGVTPGQGSEVGILFDDLVVAHQVAVPPFEFLVEAARSILGVALRRFHVVGPAQAVEAVEAVAGGQILRVLTEVPLADGLGRIALALEGASDSDLLGRQTPRRVLD